MSKINHRPRRSDKTNYEELYRSMARPGSSYKRLILSDELSLNGNAGGSLCDQHGMQLKLTKGLTSPHRWRRKEDLY